MNKFYGFVLTGTMFLLTFGTSFGQNSDNKWAIGLGMHAVDHTAIRPTVLTGLYDIDDWSIQAPVSRVWVARNLDKRINLVVDLVMGSVDNFRFNVKDEFFLDASAGVQYRLGNDKGFFSVVDPYLVGAIGYHRYDYNQVPLGGNQSQTEREFPGQGFKSRAPHTITDENSFLSVGGGIGFNIWISENWGINYQVDYKHMPAGNSDYQDFINHKAGVIFRFGSKDTDGDGIIDSKDTCPQVAGLEEFEGCPDSDGDKIIDSRDSCPQVPGLKEFNGCPDTDRDGITDASDKCPKVAGEKKNGGCPDTDGDGFIDKVDKCPREPGVAPDGCKPKITKSEIDEIGEIARTVYFKTGKNELTEESKQKLSRVAEIVVKYDNLKFDIEGHTDSVGRESTNQSLSERRANAVKDYLVSLGVDSSILTAIGYGESQPKYTNKTKEGRASNRRTEIKLIK